MSTPKRPAPRRAAPARSPAVASTPVLRRADIRLILHDLAVQMAPGDISELLAHEADLRRRAAQLAEHLRLLQRQLLVALDCLRDHVEGTCPQIPYYTIALLGAAVYYFSDEIDVIPDFLPRVGRLDDAVVMAMACQLAADGLRRYCAAKGQSVEPLLHLPARQRTPRR